MVRDNVTGLIWEAKQDKDGTVNYANPHDADNTYTWYDSNPATNGGNAGTAGDGTDTEDFINTLNTANYGGHNDWRMPTIKELAYIVNYNIPSPGPTINTNYFSNTPAAFYWSSTPTAGCASCAWGMFFYNGFNSGHVGKGTSYSVRAVRGGLTGVFDHWSINGDGTVTDTDTGLMWQQETPDNGMTWEQSLSYCENSNLAGYTDWRLPTIKELVSLVGYSRFGPAIDTTYFSDTPAGYYWSSITYASNTSYALYMCFYDGGGYNTNKSGLSYVRAVRGGQAGPSGDLDGDGFTTAQGDCNDNDATIYPGTTEICGDGIDQDCNGSDLACSSAGDFISLFDPVASAFYLKNELSGGSADTSFRFGPQDSGWMPIAGDWNGNGQETIGLFNSDPSRFYLKNSQSGGNADVSFDFGPDYNDWIPITGDWDGNGQCGIGLYDPLNSKFYLKNGLSGGNADYTFRFGPANSGWQPIFGDWNGDGKDSIGLYSPQDGKFYLRNSLSGGSAEITFLYGPKGSTWTPICGDWDGNGADGIGLFNPATSSFYLKNSLSSGNAEIRFDFGPDGMGWIPLAGTWE